MARRRHPATIASEKQHKASMSKAAAFHEVKHNPPSIVKKTERTQGKAQAKKQSVAIALSKAGLSKRQK